MGLRATESAQILVHLAVAKEERGLFQSGARNSAKDVQLMINGSCIDHCCR